jgi:hypothetical protein
MIKLGEVEASCIHETSSEDDRKTNYEGNDGVHGPTKGGFTWVVRERR